MVRLGGRGGHGFPSFLGIGRLVEAVIFEPIAVTFDVDDPGVMEEPVQDGRGDDRVAEKLLPVDEALVGGQDRRALLVPVGDELEKEISLAAVDREITDLVDDDQAGREERLPFALGFLELADQRRHGREVDLKAVTAGLDGQGDGQMGLPDAGRAQENDVFMLWKESQVEKLHNRFLVQMGVEAEVVFLDGLGKRQPGNLEGGLEASFLPGRHFLLQEMIQEGEVGGLGFPGPAGDRFQHFRRPSQLQPLEVVLEAFAGQLFHATPSWANDSYSESGR